MSSISSSPVPWQVAETVTDSASEHNSANDSGSITDFRDTLSGRSRELLNDRTISGEEQAPLFGKS
ncbi:hypothetical protein L873DRAFT_1808187, partial [Choiromyces venosus 120613-1]